MDQFLYDSFIDILKEELVPAMGCTEPIAVAYCAAIARDTLGCMPEKTELIVSGNIVKNVKSVVVPNTGGRKGLRTAVGAGLCFGKAEKELEVISDATPKDLAELDEFLKSADITITDADSEQPFDLAVDVFAGEDHAFVHIVGHHTKDVLGDIFHADEEAGCHFGGGQFLAVVLGPEAVAEVVVLVGAELLDGTVATVVVGEKQAMFAYDFTRAEEAARHGIAAETHDSVFQTAVVDAVKLFRGQLQPHLPT